MLDWTQRRSQDFFFGGGHPVNFCHLSGSRPHSVGGVVAQIFRHLNYRIGFSGGGGVVAEIVPVNASLTFPRFRDIFGAFSGHLPVIRRLWTLAEN